MFGVAVLVIAILLAALWLNRRAAAREVLVGWLDRRGIAAQVEVERLEFDGFIGRIVIGDPADPDAVVDRVEVDYAIAGPWAAGGLAVTPSRVRLVRPRVRAAFEDGDLSFGVLDPLIEEFTSRPPRPDADSPLILVENGRLNLATDYGALAVEGDARLQDGKLMRLAARVPATTLRQGDAWARGLSARADLTTTGDRVALRLDVSAEALAAPGAAADAVRARLGGDLPYPDLKRRRGDGRAALTLDASAGTLRLGDARLTGAETRMAFDGAVAGWMEAFHLTGATSLQAAADRVSGPVSGRGLALTGSGARLDLRRVADRPLAWSLAGPARVHAASLSANGASVSGVALSSAALTIGGQGAAFEAVGPMALVAGRARAGDLDLSGITGRAELDLVQDGVMRIEARGALSSKAGAWPLLGQPAAGDIPELAAMKRAFSRFALDAPAWTFAAGPGGHRLDLTRPLAVRPANGGVLTVDAADRPIFGQQGSGPIGGALRITAMRGAGLPEAAIRVPDWRLTPGGFTADLSGRAALDFGLARGIDLSTSGQLASARGVVTYSASDCVAVSVERLELEENDVIDLASGLCPSGGPLVTLAEGGWRASGRIRDASALAPFMAVRFADIEGGLSVQGGENRLDLTADIASARVQDATQPRRFEPLTAQGQARLSGEVWSGGFDLSRLEHRLGRLTLAHDGRTGVGGVQIEAPEIVFAEDGLQPSDLSPLVADFVQSPATGSAAFQGRMGWDKAGGSSDGVLTLPRLDFTSPAGAVTGLSGRVVFTSLAPLVTAPGQTLTVERLDSVTPLTDLSVAFAVDKAAVRIEGGQISAAQGTVRVEPTTIPLDPAQPVTGVIVLERVQLGDLIEGAGLDDKLKLDARVSGRLPFTWMASQGVRIADGRLEAVEAGRLSIPRTALVALEAGGAGEDVPPNVVQDLAFQAMENLAFDILTAEVNSLNAGRLGVLFRIRGRHDPPVRQELRLTWMDVIRRRFFDEPLPLPSGTQVDLTLDTTLNAGQLATDLLALDRARRAGEDDE